MKNLTDKERKLLTKQAARCGTKFNESEFYVMDFSVEFVKNMKKLNKEITMQHVKKLDDFYANLLKEEGAADVTTRA